MTFVRLPLWGQDGTIAGYALVDRADVEKASRYRWCRAPNGGAQRKVRVDGKRTTQLLHRLLMGLEHGDPRQVDHINRNRDDNRRANLRIVTNAQNGQNRSLTGYRTNTSGLRGVYWHKQHQKWSAIVIINYIRHHLGYYQTKEEAGEVVAAFRREHMPFSASDQSLFAGVEGQL